MAAATDYLTKAAPLWTGTVGSGGHTSGSTTVPLSAVTGLTNGEVYYATVDRVDINGTATPSLRTVYKGLLSGTNLINCSVVEGTEQNHAAGKVVEILFTATQWNDLMIGLLVEHNATGTHKFTQILDANGNESLKLGVTASAVNEITVTNAATGNGPTISATGGDTNIDLNLQPKGTGAANVKGTSTSAAEVRLFEDTDNGTNYIGLKAPASVGTSKTFTLPNADGSANQVLKTDGSGSLGWATQGLSVQEQANTTNTTRSSAVVQDGWAFVTGDGVNGVLTKAITFPSAFSTVPIVVVQFLGEKDSSDPSTAGDNGYLQNIQAVFAAEAVSTSGFTLRLRSSATTTSGRRYQVAWIAIGS